MADGHTQVCLVSHQPIPNLIPMVDEALRPKKVILLVSKDMTERAQWLAKEARTLGCQVSEIPFEPYDFEAARGAIFEVLAQNEEAVLNVTGGTKVMALAVFDMFRGLGKPVFYVDTDNGKFLHLAPKWSEDQLPDVMKVRPYLGSYGYQINSQERREVPKEWVELGEAMRKERKWQGPLRTLNFLASKARVNNSLISPETDKWDWSSFRELINIFAGAKILWREENSLRFRDDNARFFANGGWLEQFIFGTIQRLRSKLGVIDLSGSVTVCSAKGVPNEFDILFTARNRLHIIECKTTFGQTDKVMQSTPVYKLDSLKDVVAGRFGKAMLISYFDIDDQTKRRCDDLKVTSVGGSELNNLDSRLAEWIRSR